MCRLMSSITYLKGGIFERVQECIESDVAHMSLDLV